MLIGFAMGTFEAPSTEKFTADSKNFPQHNLCFLGMVAITDPIRDDTITAIQKCKAAGIKIFMITGDHPSTATAIARQIGLIGGTEMVRFFMQDCILIFRVKISNRVVVEEN
jgi:magnesium-transporting ATPase (P-type)